MVNGKRLKLKVSEKGYTLIEILVGLTIIGLIFSIGYVNFRDFSRREAVAGTGKKIQGDIRLAQQLALSGEKPDDIKCNGANNLNGYNFRIYSANEYRIESACTGGDVVYKAVILPSGITVTTPSPNPILFKVLGQGTNIGSGTEIVLTLTQTRTNNRFTVTIGAGGEIK
jgi:prepilin-type N-terminal cleavage/methylation domain-containing protein